MSQSEPLVPFELNLTLTSADTEYSQELPVGTKGFSMQCRTDFAVRFAFQASKVAASGDPHSTIKAQSSYTAPEKIGWSWTTAGDVAPVIYFASAEAGVVVEIVGFKDIR